MVGNAVCTVLFQFEVSLHAYIWTRTHTHIMMGLWQSSNCNSVQRLYSAFIITGAPFTTVREHRLLSAQVKGLEKILATIVYVCV